MNIITFEGLKTGDKVFLIKNGDPETEIKTLLVRHLYAWDAYRETYDLGLREETSDEVAYSFEVHGYNCVEESVDDTDYTIATDKSLLLEMLAKE